MNGNNIERSPIFLRGINRNFTSKKDNLWEAILVFFFLVPIEDRAIVSFSSVAKSGRTYSMISQSSHHWPAMQDFSFWPWETRRSPRVDREVPMSQREESGLIVITEEMIWTYCRLEWICRNHCFGSFLWKKTVLSVFLRLLSSVMQSIADAWRRTKAQVATWQSWPCCSCIGTKCQYLCQ